MDDQDVWPILTMNPCVRYLLENMDWFEEEIGDYDDDYLIFDCPGMSVCTQTVGVEPRPECNFRADRTVHSSSDFPDFDIAS